MTQKYLNGLFSALFPDCCTACDEPLFESDIWQRGNDSGVGVGPTGDGPHRNLNQAMSRHSHHRQWCPQCWDQLAVTDKLQCSFCAAEIRATNPLEQRCRLCRRVDLRFDRVISLGNYAGLLRRLVIEMKNQRIDQVAIRLAHVLSWKLQQQRWLQRLDAVVAVPTHWRRRLLRGFCAAEILAETLARDVGVAYERKLVRCSRSTEKQGRLSITRRRKNVVGAFQVSAQTDLTDRVLLVVDDVMTSGATASELAKVLKKRGAAAVFVAVVARGAGAS